MKKDDTVYIRHIRDASQKIERYTRGVSPAAFRKNDLLIDAVVRELSVIGEAAAHVSETFRQAQPTLPFYEMIGMRNRIIHEYFNVDVDVVWQTVRNDLPALKKALSKITV